MISVTQAKRLIEKHVSILPAHMCDLSSALDAVMAEDVIVPMNLPRFDNSAMDGFTLHSRDVKKATKNDPVMLKVKGDIRAGQSRVTQIKPGETYRIMTGAMIPKRGDTVIAKENAVIQDGFLILTRPIPRGHHVRKCGEELRRGKRVALKSSVINPGMTGFLASIGKRQVRVYKKPRVSLLVTGSELASMDQKLKSGEIFDSNSPMLKAALKNMGLEPVLNARVGDSPRKLERILDKAFRQSDVVILSGGVSVGEYDFVKQTLAQKKVRTIFWKVRQKPGKPLYFGKKESCLVFGLPGNPVSAFTCFYVYVYPALMRMMGKSVERPINLPQGRLTVNADSSRTLFLKANGRVSQVLKSADILQKQASHMISALCETNMIVQVPELPTRRNNIKIYPIPYAE